MKYSILIPMTLLVIQSNGDSLPESFPSCDRNDDNFMECLRFAIMEAVHQMQDGMDELGVPPIKPLKINEIKIRQGKGAVNLQFQFKNVQLHGILDSFITNNSVLLNETRLTLDTYTPKLWFESDYVGSGRVLFLPIKGNGKCNITMTDLNTHMNLQFEPYEKDRKTYWGLKDFKVTFKPKRTYYYFENLLKPSPNKNLDDGVNKFLNDNWKPVFEELCPPFEVAFGNVFKNITHRIFDKVPIDEIFLKQL